MGKKKAGAKNPYYFFIMEKKKDLEDKGYRIGNFENASREFGPQWSRMSKEDRAPYEKMAKDAKAEMQAEKAAAGYTVVQDTTPKNSLHKKFAVTGESYADIQRKNVDLHLAEKQMEAFIRRLTKGRAAVNRTYIFVKAVYCVEEIVGQAKPKQYWPCEITLAAFSLKEGLKAVYTTLVDIGEAPVGYASQVKDTAEETGLPLPGDRTWFKDQHRNYLRILQNINGFANHWLKDGYDVHGHRKVFFALNEERHVFASCMQWLVDQLPGGEHREKYEHFVTHLKVYKISKLVIMMAEEANRVNPSYNSYLVKIKLETAADQVVLKGRYDYNEDIACLYHKTEEASMKIDKCAQSIVMSRIFDLFEEFTYAYNIPTLARHRIEKLSKLRGPVAKRRRTNEPGEEAKVCSAPSWIRDDKKKDVMGTKARVASPPRSCASEASSKPAWLNEPPNSKPASSRDNFPVLGASANDGKKVPVTRITLKDPRSLPRVESHGLNDGDFPALGSDPRLSRANKNHHIPPAASLASHSVEGTSDDRHNPSPPCDKMEETYEDSCPPREPKSFMDDDDDVVPAKQALGRGRGVSSEKSFMDDDDDDDFPPLGATPAGRGRGRGGGW